MQIRKLLYVLLNCLLYVLFCFYNVDLVTTIGYFVIRTTLTKAIVERIRKGIASLKGILMFIDELEKETKFNIKTI